MGAEQVVRRAAWWGLFWNLALCALKLSAGIMSHSRALVADGVHSLSDILTDFAVIAGSFFWSRPPDDLHPYGHRRLETFVTVFIALMLMAAGGGIIMDSLDSFQGRSGSRPGLWALAAAMISIVVKELLYRWTLLQGQKVGSPALKANARHHRSDALSSVPVVLAVGGYMVFPSLFFLDALGAVVVAGFIFKSAWDILWPALQEFSDAGAPHRVYEKIQGIALAHPQVHGIHQVRTRYQSGAMFVDYHLVLPGRLSLFAAHAVGEDVSARIRRALPEIVDLTYHLDPCESQDD